MLSAGDLLWVPFTYSYTAYFLALHPTDLGVSGCAGVLAVQLIGYYIFRVSNNEKNEFRLGRNPKSASAVPLCRAVLHRDEARMLTGSAAASRPQVVPDGARHSPPHLGLVGPVAAPQLVRLASSSRQSDLDTHAHALTNLALLPNPSRARLAPSPRSPHARAAWATGSCRGRGASPAGSRARCLTSTSSTLPSCSSTARPATTRRARTSASAHPPRARPHERGHDRPTD